MEENNDNSSSNFKLLQPDLMTIEELCEILRACCVKNDLTSYSKSELVELFKRVALPLPQREYNSNNWRQKVLLKTQKRKATERNINQNVKKLCTTNGSSKITSLAPQGSNNVSSKYTPTISSSPTTSRLKPPINVNNYTKKVLKLALPVSKSSVSSDVKKIVIDKKHSIQNKDGGPVIKKVNIDEKKDDELFNKTGKTPSNVLKQAITNGKHKRIVIDFSDSTTTTTKTPKVTNLKRAISNNEIPGSAQKVRKTINI